MTPTLIVIGDYCINLNNMCDLHVYSSSSGATIIQITYANSSTKIPCKGSVASVKNQLRDAISKHCNIIQGPSGLNLEE